MTEIQAILEKHALVAFSVYTHIQVEVLKELAATIRGSLDTIVSEGQVQAPGFNKVYGEFWLWVIGVYEVVRTMDQAKGSFSARASTDIHAFKQRVAKLRIPFAKQEYSGSTRGGIAGQTSVAGVDARSRDFTYEIRGETFSVRELLTAFETLMGSTSRADVLKDHREAYGP